MIQGGTLCGCGQEVLNGYYGSNGCLWGGLRVISVGLTFHHTATIIGLDKGENFLLLADGLTKKD